ncbi:hypothetical protein ACQPXT_31935 [Streptomyces sp. CA-100214]
MGDVLGRRALAQCARARERAGERGERGGVVGPCGPNGRRTGGGWALGPGCAVAGRGVAVIKGFLSPLGNKVAQTTAEVDARLGRRGRDTGVR